MALRLTGHTFKLLTSLAEHRVLTVAQLAALNGRSRKVIRRRLRDLEQAGLLRSAVCGFGKGRGRPEKILSLSEQGVALLREERSLPSRLPPDQVTAEGLLCVDHQLLINWFRIHLVQLERVLPRLKVRFLSPTSPFLARDHVSRPLVFEQHPPTDGAQEMIAFTPDGVFGITDTAQARTLLFYLEVDRGTESLASPQRDHRDIRQKILNYQALFRSGLHRRHGQLWQCSLKGFRLLFLTHSPGRLATLCRLVREMPPSDFVWLTDQERLFAEGAAAAIWVRGGRDETTPQSILGREMPQRAPLPLSGP